MCYSFVQSVLIWSRQFQTALKGITVTVATSNCWLRLKPTSAFNPPYLKLVFNNQLTTVFAINRIFPKFRGTDLAVGNFTYSGYKMTIFIHETTEKFVKSATEYLKTSGKLGTLEKVNQFATLNQTT